MGSIPHTVRASWPAMRPDRFAGTFSTDAAPPSGASVALLGLPSDVGTALNQGRTGSALGPAALRLALTRIAADWDVVEGRPIDVRVWDVGDVPPAPGTDAAALHETHRRVSEATRAIADLGLPLVCIGGSHDLTFAAARGVSQALGVPLGGMNVDAHLDVRDPREEPGSGMPFRALIEGGFVDPDRFLVFGADRFVNSREHHRWLAERGGTVVAVEKALAFRSAVNTVFDRISRGVSEPAFVSVDLDSIDGSQAPGVSAVNPMGLPVADVSRLAARAGADPRVRYFDIMELCPIHDEPPSAMGAPVTVAGRTARVAASILMRFLAGMQDRPHSRAGTTPGIAPGTTR